MASGIDTLFDYASGLVTAADIAACAPSDPGYSQYVHALCRIVESRKQPDRAEFDIVEPVNLSRWLDPGSNENPERCRRFRAFTNAIGMSLRAAGACDNDTIPANYLAISLIDDAHALGDSALLRLLAPGFEDFHDALRRRGCEEAPFLLLGLLLLGVRTGSSQQALDDLAGRLIGEESEHAGRASREFLWGCTGYDRLHDRWRWFVRQWLASSSSNLELLKAALLEGA